MKNSFKESNKLNIEIRYIMNKPIHSSSINILKTHQISPFKISLIRIRIRISIWKSLHHRFITIMTQSMKIAISKLKILMLKELKTHLSARENSLTLNLNPITNS